MGEQSGDQFVWIVHGPAVSRSSQGGITEDKVGRIIPTLMIAGGASAFMRGAAQALADVLPSGEVRILEGQTHDIEPSVLGPVLQAFLAQ